MYNLLSSISLISVRSTMQKIIRSICYYSKEIDTNLLQKLNALENAFQVNQFQVQTKRICSPAYGFTEIEKLVDDSVIMKNVGVLNLDETNDKLDDFLKSDNVAFNLDASSGEIIKEYVDVLFKIINTRAGHTFNFTYSFNVGYSSPFFPAAKYQRDGFSIGLQPTNLAKGCNSLDKWFANMEKVWNEIFDLYKTDPDFLGIDSSIAPLYRKEGSFINFVEKLGHEFINSSTTDIYLRTSNFIKKNNPKLIGLSGLMFPCLEDFDLADEYEQGNFPIERNIYLSLHSGLGIDTYPIGTDESPERVLEILKTLQGLSNKYQKPLSARFVSDGKAKIGDMTDFQNQYLKDVIVNKL